MSDRNHDDELQHARSLLESVTLLETVATEREAQVEELLGYLTSHGLTAAQLAAKLDVSLDSVKVLIEREEPKPPHKRVGLSEESIQQLDPLAGDGGLKSNAAPPASKRAAEGQPAAD